MCRSVLSLMVLALAKVLTDQRWRDGFVVQTKDRAFRECVMESGSELSSFALRVKALIYSLEEELVRRCRRVWRF